jgi:hypothetical protein
MAALYIIYIKNVVGAFIRKLLAEGCLSEETAKTAEELGYGKNPLIRAALRGTMTRGTVYSVLPKAEQGSEPADGEDKPKDKGEDSAPTMKQMLAEFSKREELYKSVEPLVGSFDHAEMTACEVAKYAAGKLGLATVDGAEVAIVQANIAGRADGAKNVRAALDSSAGAEEGPSASLRKFLGE